MKYAIYITAFIIIFIAAWYLFQTGTQIMLMNSPNGEEEVKEGRGMGIKEESIEEIAADFENLAKDFDDKTPFIIKRVWVEDDNFYVEYENQASMLGQLLVEKEGDDYAGIGYFSSSESGWELQAGRGELASPEALLYQKNVQGQWIRKN